MNASNAIILFESNIMDALQGYCKAELMSRRDLLNPCNSKKLFNPLFYREIDK
jgi:hypothetical protein